VFAEEGEESSAVLVMDIPGAGDALARCWGKDSAF
jgi:hypothetical protein